MVAVIPLRHLGGIMYPACPDAGPRTNRPSTQAVTNASTTIGSITDPTAATSRSADSTWRCRSSTPRPGCVETQEPDSDMHRGSVDELLDVTVECAVLDQLEVEGGCTLEDRVQPGLTGDHGEERHLDAVDEAGGHQRPVQRQAAVRTQRHLGLLLESGDDIDGVAAHNGRVRPF